MQWIRGRVDALVESPVDAEGEVVVDVVGKSFPFQNKFDDSGSNGLREEVDAIRVEPVEGHP